MWAFGVAYARSPARGKSIVLFGENGCGKTRTLKAVFRWASRLAIDLPLVRGDDMGVRLSKAEYAHWPAIVDGFKRQQFLVMDDLRDGELLCLDDVGAEYDPSGFGSEQLYLLLSRREFRWNLITTNFPPAAWHEKFERRIASRLFRNAEHVDLSQVPDYSTL